MARRDATQAAWERENMVIRMDIGAWLAMTGKEIGDLAKALGVCKSTMYSKYHNPGRLTVDEARKLYQVIGKAAEYRQAI